MRIGIRTVLSHQFYLCKVQSYIVYKHLLILLIHYEWSTLNNYGFLIKEDFWHVVSILDFTGLNVYITFIRTQNFSSICIISKNWYDNVNYMQNSKSYKIRNFSPISTKFLKENYAYFIYNGRSRCKDRSYARKREGTLSERWRHRKNFKVRKLKKYREITLQ